MLHSYKQIPVSYNPFRGPEIEKIAPSTESQKEIYVSTLIGGSEASLSYNESVTLKLDGRLAINTLQNAFLQLIKRHEALRSAISKNGKNIIIYKNIDFKLGLFDKSSASAEEKISFLNTIALQEVNTTFNLNEGPLFRVIVIKQSDNEFYLVLTGHHIVFDGWSMGVILLEVSKLYTALAKNKEPDLAEAKQISDYAKEEIIFQKSEYYKDIKKFWLTQFNGKDFAFDLPADYPRPVNRTYKSKRLDFIIKSSISLNIKKIGAKAGTSFVNTLMVAFEILLAKISNTNQLILGLPTAAQSVTNNTNLIGHCVNILPLKSSINQNLSFIEYLKTRNNQLLDAYEHQRFTFGSLLKAFNFPRDPSRMPLLPVVFNVDLGYDSGVSFEGLTHQLISNPRSFETFELFLNISGSEKNLTVEWSYNTQLFKQESIEKYQKYLVKLLTVFSQNPNIVLKDISLSDNFSLIKHNKKSLNDTQKAYPKEKTLPYFIEKTAKKFPLRIAVSTINDKITYQDLALKANQFSLALQHAGIKVGDKVGIAVDRSIEMVIALIGILKSGAAYLPFDPTYPTERIEYMLEDAEAQYLITTKTYKNRFLKAAKTLFIEDILKSLEAFDGSTLGIEFNSDKLLYILHTSGSTGKPKGVQVAHYNVINLLLCLQKELSIKQDDKLLATTTISFDIAQVEIFLPLITGAELMIADKDAVRDAEQLLDLMETQQITIMQATPSRWQMLLDANWEKKFNIKLLSSGEPLSKNLAQNIFTKCNELWNLYGPTETTIYSTLNKVNINDEIISIGKPVYNTQIYFLNESLSEVEDGKIGEIYIGGDGVTKGYINKDNLTAERYLPNQFSIDANSTLYRTGDLGRLLPNGEIQCLGRIDNQVKVRGYRIELGEIEQVLLNQPNIDKAIVTAIELQPGNQQLVAYIIPKNYNPINKYLIEIKNWKAILGNVLPSFMIPAIFYTLKDYPLTPNGKIDKNALPTPLKNSDIAKKEFITTQTEEEKIILKIWREALKVEQITVTDNFFEIGGHSLLAVQVMQEIETVTGVKLPLASLFEYANVQQLAKLIAPNKQQPVQWNSLVKIKPTGNKTPLYLIHGSGLNVLMYYSIAKYADEEQPIYGLQSQGLDGHELPFNTIEEIAAFYNKEILEDNPDGPFAFIGYSLGGIIALEMSKQLQAMGKTVTFLGVVDTYINNEDYFKSFAKKLQAKILRQPRKLAFFGKQFLTTPIETIRYQFGHLQHFSQKIFSKPQRAADKTVEDYYMDACMHYKLTPYQNTIHLFKVKKRMYYLDDPCYLGWMPYAPAGLRVNEIPGDHATFLLPPNDQISTAIFLKALNEA